MIAPSSTWVPVPQADGGWFVMPPSIGPGSKARYRLASLAGWLGGWHPFSGSVLFGLEHPVLLLQLGGDGDEQVLGDRVGVGNLGDPFAQPGDDLGVGVDEVGDDVVVALSAGRCLGQPAVPGHRRGPAIWGHADRGGPLGHGVGVLAYGVDSRPAGSPPRRRWRIRGEKLQERLAKLAGGVAVIKVGAATEVELKVRKHRIEDAVRNAKAAVEEGILPGGGVALVQAGTTVFDKLDLAGDEGTGAHIVQVALEAPLRQIAVNAGLEGGVVADKVKTLPDGHGQDANTGEYVDMLAAGIIDPA